MGSPLPYRHAALNQGAPIQPRAIELSKRLIDAAECGMHLDELKNSLASSVIRPALATPPCAGATLVTSRRRAQKILQALAKASAQLQSDLGFQYDLVLTCVLQLEPNNPIEVHDD